MSVQQGGGAFVIAIPKRVCVKCKGNIITGPAWTGRDEYSTKPATERDKLKYTCATCGYNWLEKCADAK